MLQHPGKADQGAAKIDCGALKELWINNPWKLNYLLWCGWNCAGRLGSTELIPLGHPLLVASIDLSTHDLRHAFLWLGYS